MMNAVLSPCRGPGGRGCDHHHDNFLCNSTKIMKTTVWLLVFGAAAFFASGQVGDTLNYTAVERGSHFTRWQSTGPTNSEGGGTYIELANALNYRDESGAFVPSQEIIEPIAGGAVARRGDDVTKTGPVGPLLELPVKVPAPGPMIRFPGESPTPTSNPPPLIKKPAILPANKVWQTSKVVPSK